MLFNPLTSLLLIASSGISFHSASEVLPRDYQISAQSQTEVSVFVQSFQSLAQSFDQCSNSIQQQASASVIVSQSKKLRAQYQTTYHDYQSCTSCSTDLSAYNDQIYQSVSTMIAGFKTIVQSAQQQNNYELNATIQRLNGFFPFAQTVCKPLKIDLNAVCGKLKIDINIFGKVGININIGGILGGILAGGGGGILGGLLG